VRHTEAGTTRDNSLKSFVFPYLKGQGVMPTDREAILKLPHAVVKEDKVTAYNDEERSLGAHLYQVLVCEDCVGWYEDSVDIEGKQ
jgi:hypothetical protein